MRDDLDRGALLNFDFSVFACVTCRGRVYENADFVLRGRAAEGALAKDQEIPDKLSLHARCASCIVMSGPLREKK